MFKTERLYKHNVINLTKKKKKKNETKNVEMSSEIEFPFL